MNGITLGFCLWLQENFDWIVKNMGKWHRNHAIKELMEKGTLPEREPKQRVWWKI